MMNFNVVGSAAKMWGQQHVVQAKPAGGDLRFVPENVQRCARQSAGSQRTE